MERGDGGSNARRGNNNNNTQLNNAQDITKITLNKIRNLYGHRRVRRGTTVTYHDMTCAGYGWLLPGWIAEERRVPSGRVYRYYYDPEGCFYESQRKVREALEQSGIIVIDT